MPPPFDPESTFFGNLSRPSQQMLSITLGEFMAICTGGDSDPEKIKAFTVAVNKLIQEYTAKTPLRIAEVSLGLMLTIIAHAEMRESIEGKQSIFDTIPKGGGDA